MKKIILIAAAALFLSACSQQAQKKPHSTHTTSSPQARQSSKYPQADIHKKYPGLKLMTVPAEFRGTWYRSDPFANKARKLVITKHLVNGSVLYRKISQIKLDHNSLKQKKYAGDISLGRLSQKNGQNWLRVQDILGTVDLVYISGAFKGHKCLYLAYSSGDIHSAIFKNPQVALKYRKYDFSRVLN